MRTLWLVLFWLLFLPVLAALPAEVGGLVLWVRGDAGVTVDAAGRVAAWADASGKGNDFRQQDPALQPLLVKDAVNGLPALRWDGIDDDLALAASLPVSGKSVFAVVKWHAARTYSFALGLDAGTDGYLRLHGPDSLLVGGRYPMLYQNSLASPKVGYTPGDGKQFFHNKLDSLLQWNVYAVTDNPPSNEKLKHLGMNELNNVPANRFSGDIAEVLVYDRALTAAERLQVEDYLEQKYLGWPAMVTIPVKTNPADEQGFPGLAGHWFGAPVPLGTQGERVLVQGQSERVLPAGRYYLHFATRNIMMRKPGQLLINIDGQSHPLTATLAASEQRFEFVRPIGASTTPSLVRITWKDTATDPPSSLQLQDTHIEVLPPIVITRLQPDKILYAPGGQALARATLHNYAADPVSCAVRMSEVTGLDDRRVLGTKTVTVPAGGDVTVELPYVAGATEYGRDLLAEVLQGGKVVETKTEPYAVADNLWKVAIGSTQVGTTADYTEAGIVKQMQEIRVGYGNWFEKDFWAPDDWGMMTPPPGLTWFSGQARRHENTEKMQLQVKAAHDLGIKAITYGKCMAGGVPGWELARAKPQWFSVDAYGRTIGRPGDVWDMDHWQEPDKQYRDFKYIWTYRWVDLRREDALQHGIDQLIASAKQFGWDGVRYDSGGFRAHFVDGQFDGIDSFNARNMRTTKERVWKALPGFLFGVNTNDPVAKDGCCPQTPGDPTGHEFREMLAGGGLWMFEGMRDKPNFWGRRTYKLWSDYAQDMAITMRTIRGYGGHACCSYGDTELYKFLIGTMVGCHDYMGEHLRAGGSEHWGRFLTRWSQFVWDPRLRPLPNEAKMVKVTADRPLWWQGFANELVVSPTKRYVIIHLLNPPVNDEIAKTKTEVPAPLARCTVELGHGLKEKVVKTTFIAPGFPNRAESVATMSSEAGVAHLVLPRLDLWGMVVVELAGNYTVPKDAPAFTEPLSAAELAEMTRCAPTPNVPVADNLLNPTPRFDPEKAKLKEWPAPTVTPPAELKIGGEPGTDVLIIKGFYHETYRLPEALALLAPEVRVTTCTTRDLPRDYPALYKYDAVVLVDMSADAWNADGLQRLADFARAGGRLVVLGGPFTLGQGFFAGSPLAVILPVTVRPARDVYQAPKPLTLGAQKGVPLLGKPTLYYYHAVTPRPGATVRLWAGELPLRHEIPAGAGTVCVFTAAPLGEPTGNGDTPFWLWTGWANEAVKMVLGK